MERLTFDDNGCKSIKACKNELCLETCINVDSCSGCPINHAIDKLSDYEDMEEQARLANLAFPVGGKVFALWSVQTASRYVIYEAEVKEICIGIYNTRMDIQYRIEPISYRGRILKYYSADVGKLLFADQQQAEQALQAMKQEQS